jgi:hypothetical protein
MNSQAETDLIYDKAANGNPQARAFLGAWNEYCHAIDDLIDDEVKDYNRLLELLIKANLLYTMPFYQQHAIRLLPVVTVLTNNYADSIAWEHEVESWKSQWSDIMRFSANDMVVAVASICGGQDLMREVSPMLKELAWISHHTEDGTPQ